jgi:hypothetical protein
VLLPAAATLRRANPTVVIGSALLASARGTGYRRIAAQLHRPLSTVPRWIRAVRDPAHVEWLRRQGVQWLALVDRDVLGGLRPEATPLGEALTALAAVAVTLRARVAPHVPAWTLIGQITTAGSAPRPPHPRRAEITHLPGPRAPAAGRHRDDAEPRRQALACGTVTTTPPP